MTYYSINNPFPTILNQIGGGLNGGFIYIGMPDQDPEVHPQDVYWDVAGADLAAQPLFTAGGYITRSGTPATVYISGLTYSIRVKDRFGVQVYYAAAVNDPVTAVVASLSSPTGSSLVGSDDGASGSLWTTVAGFITYLRSSVGSSILGFLQAGTGALPRTIQDELRDSINVKQFGAKGGNGTTDDTAAINAALAYAETIGAGVYFPAGIYLTSDTITARAGVSMIGAGRFVSEDGLTFKGSWIKYRGPAANPALLLHSIQKCTFRNFGLDGGKVVGTTAIAIESDNNPACKSHLFTEMNVFGFGMGVKWGAGGSLTAFEQCDDFTFSEMQFDWVTNCFRVNAPNAADYSRIERCGFGHVEGIVFDLPSAKMLSIVDCTAGTYDDAIMFNISGASPAALRIIQCQNEPGGKFMVINGPNDQQTILLEANVVNLPIEANGILSIASRGNFFNSTVTTTGSVRWSSDDDKWDSVLGQPLHAPQITIGAGGIFRANVQRNARGFVGQYLPVGFSFDNSTFTAGGYERTGVTRAGVIAPAFATSGTYVVGDYVQPTTPNDHAYVVTVAGTAGGTEPTWPTTSGGTVTSGGVTFQEIGPSAITKGVGAIAA